MAYSDNTAPVEARPEGRFVRPLWSDVRASAGPGAALARRRTRLDTNSEPDAIVRAARPLRRAWYTTGRVRIDHGDSAAPFSCASEQRRQLVAPESKLYADRGVLVQLEH